MLSLNDGKASQKRILVILNELETITQRDLTERLGIQPGSASEILSKMESAGWICRPQNETDRRTIDVCLTDSGRELAAEALTQRRKRHEDMFPAFQEKKNSSCCHCWKQSVRIGGTATANMDIIMDTTETRTTMEGMDITEMMTIMEGMDITERISRLTDYMVWS